MQTMHDQATVQLPAPALPLLGGSALLECNNLVER